MPGEFTFDSGRRSTRVMVRPGIRREVPIARDRRTLVVVDQSVADSFGKDVAESLQAQGVAVATLTIEATESAKSLETVGRILDAALAHRVDRGGVLVSVGGGITGDLVGCAAALHLRGVEVMHVPTTLLAMVDAALGGKTGANRLLPDGSLGKNLLGVFWPPSYVLVDVETLSSLPDRERRCGLAEALKHGLLRDPDLLTFIRDHRDALLSAEVEACDTLALRAGQIKASVVAEDAEEHGVRAILNLGHTFAHAIEGEPGLSYQHGEAVGLGLIAAARLAVALQQAPESFLAEVRSDVELVGLPVTMPQAPDGAGLLGRMGFDKKNTASGLRFVVPTPPCGAVVRSDVPEDAVVAAWREVGVVFS
jgi:3-dehydroquinate synthase